MVLGKALAEGQGLSYAVVPGSPPAAKFPPVYPLTLAALWTAFPAFPENVRLFELANLVFLAGAAGLFTAFQMGVLGLPGWIAAGVSIFGFAGVEIWRIAVVPLSEPLFLLLIVLALMAATRVEVRARPSPGDWLLMVLALWLVWHTRTVGVSVTAAAVGALALRRRFVHAGVLAGAIGVLALPWALWGRSVTERIPAPLRDVLGPYGPWIVDQVLADPVAVLLRLPGEATSLVAHLATALLPGLPPLLRAAALVSVAPVLALGAAYVWKSSRTTVLTAGFYLTLVWVWPFKDFRLVAPVFPLLALFFGAGAFALWRGEANLRWRRLGLALACGWAAWFGVHDAWGLAKGAHLDGYGSRTRLLSEAVRSVRADTPASAIVGAPDLWAGLGLYTGRRVAPSARFLPLSGDGPVWGTPDQQIGTWRASGLTHLLAEHGGVVHGQALEALITRCRAAGVDVVAEFSGGARLVRLPDPDSCEEAAGP